MLFATDVERDAYFCMAEENPNLVRFGSALCHAVETDLGIWGRKEILLNDVAQIMALEVTRVSDTQGDFSWRMSPDIIKQSPRFQSAYSHARTMAEGRMAKAFRSYGAHGLAEQLEREHLLISSTVPFVEHQGLLLAVLAKVANRELPNSALENEGKKLAEEILAEMRSGLRSKIQFEPRQ